MAAFLPMLGEFIMTGIEGGVATGLATEAYNEFAPKVKKVITDETGKIIKDGMIKASQELDENDDEEEKNTEPLQKIPTYIYKRKVLHSKNKGRKHKRLNK